jgi:hypothetical protein
MRPQGRVRVLVKRLVNLGFAVRRPAVGCRAPPSFTCRDPSETSSFGRGWLWRFADRRADSARAERRAQQLIAISFYVLAAYVGLESVRALALGQHPDASWVGIGLAAVTVVTMPILARMKRRAGEGVGSSATVSESGQTMLCATFCRAVDRVERERLVRVVVG